MMKEAIQFFNELQTEIKNLGIYKPGYKLAVESHIFNEDGQIILIKRGPKCRDEIGKYEGIGGEVLNETDIHQALREKVKKRIGKDVEVSVDLLLEIRPVTFFNEKLKAAEDWIIASYLCRLIKGIPTNEDKGKVENIVYFTVEELLNLNSEKLSRSTQKARISYFNLFGTEPFFKK